MSRATSVIALGFATLRLGAGVATNRWATGATIVDMVDMVDINDG